MCEIDSVTCQKRSYCEWYMSSVNTHLEFFKVLQKRVKRVWSVSWCYIPSRLIIRNNYYFLIIIIIIIIIIIMMMMMIIGKKRIGANLVYYRFNFFCSTEWYNENLYKQVSEAPHWSKEKND